MENIETLWAAKQAAEKAEQSATVAHDAAELNGGGPDYDAALEALVQSRINLQFAEEQYDAAIAAN